MSSILSEQQIRDAYDQFTTGSGLPAWKALTEHQRQDFRLRFISRFAECQKKWFDFVLVFNRQILHSEYRTMLPQPVEKE